MDRIANGFAYAAILIVAAGLLTVTSSTTAFSKRGQLPAAGEPCSAVCRRCADQPFHIEWAAEQHLSKQFSAGFIGYYYQQLTGDGSAGAVLGPFKGRTFALGGTMAFNFEVDQRPWTLRFKAYRELDVKNRLEGTAGYLTLSVPLHVMQMATQAPSIRK